MKLIRYFVVPVMLTALTGPVLAGGSQYKVTFENNGKAPAGAEVDVLFTAAGCIQSKRCGTDGANTPVKEWPVCKQTLNLKPGETTTYSFKAGTSGRKVVVCSKSMNSSKLRSRKKTSSRRHTYVCANLDGGWELAGGKNCDNKIDSIGAAPRVQ